jgi:hypothetical protein
MNIVPSIELIPAKYGVGTLLTQVPMDVSGDFSVTRATAVATRYNSAGLIETIASGIPRLDYYTSSGTPGCPALLVEPSAINLVPNGLGYNAAAGVIYDTTITDSPAIGINSTRITKSVGAGNLRYAVQICSANALASSTTYTISRFFKYNGVDFVTSMQSNTNTQWGAVGWIQLINIASTGVTLGGSTLCTGSVENFGNGWYRVSVRITTGVTISGGTPVTYLMILPAALSADEGMLTALPQLETSSVATSYIPTTTGSVTRDADVINKTGVSGLIGQTQGTIYAEFRYLGNPIVRAGFVFLRQTGFRGLSINFAPSDFPSGIFFISRNNAGSTSIRLTNGLTLGAYYKIAVSYDAGGTAAGGTQASGVTAYVNGSPATVSVGDLRVPDANLNELRLYGANSGDENEVPNGNLRAAAVYKTRLPNYLLESATSQIQSYSALASSLSYTVV